jgi:phosphate transport system substrate-binding protein
LVPERGDALTRTRTFAAAAALVLALSAAACNTQGNSGGDDTDSASGTVNVDGSSTVFPITEAIAEEFSASSPEVDVRVGQSGTGGGFEKFCRGDIDIADASRPIEDDEQKACRDAGIEWVELQVAIDGLSVVVNKDNDFADCLTVAELKKIWEPGSKVKTWKDIKPEWPEEELKLYGPGSDSGTFDFFTKEINGEESASRSDFTQSEDDNQLVQGVKADKDSLGYFGFAYLEANLDSIRAVAVDGGDGCVEPTDETIEDGTYKPLSRPLFIYPSKEALAKEHIASFVEYYLDTVNDILADVKYVPLPDDELSASKKALSDVG